MVGAVAVDVLRRGAFEVVGEPVRGTRAEDVLYKQKASKRRVTLRTVSTSSRRCRCLVDGVDVYSMLSMNLADGADAIMSQHSKNFKPTCGQHSTTQFAPSTEEQHTTKTERRIDDLQAEKKSRLATRKALA